MKVTLSACTIAFSLATFGGHASAAPLAPQEQSQGEFKMQRIESSIRKSLQDEVDQCVGDSPLNSRRQECGRKSPRILDQVRSSENNCKRYYARGTREQLDCRISSYERAEQSLKDSKPFVPFENPDGSDKTKKNTFKKI